MYRGKSFLLQRAYTVHLGVIETLIAPEFAHLWNRDFGLNLDDADVIPTLVSAINAIRGAYAPHKPTDTLVTKILLGTLGCLPAVDRYFIAGFKHCGFSYSYLNASFYKRLLQFCRNNAAELQGEQARILKCTGVHYPIMKLVDMYFWQTGYDLG